MSVVSERVLKLNCPWNNKLKTLNLKVKIKSFRDKDRAISIDRDESSKFEKTRGSWMICFWRTFH